MRPRRRAGTSAPLENPLPCVEQPTDPSGARNGVRQRRNAQARTDNQRIALVPEPGTFSNMRAFEHVLLPSPRQARKTPPHLPREPAVALHAALELDEVRTHRLVDLNHSADARDAVDHHPHAFIHPRPHQQLHEHHHCIVALVRLGVPEVARIDERVVVRRRVIAVEGQDAVLVIELGRAPHRCHPVIVLRIHPCLRAHHLRELDNYFQVPALCGPY